MAIHKSKWFLPGFSVLLGLIIAVAFWIGDEPGEALWALGIMSGFGLLVLVGGRFELIRGLRGDGRDEYWERIDIHATALTGLFLISLVIAMCIWEWAHGRDGSPYAQLGAITGLAYIAAVGFLRWRS